MIRKGLDRFKSLPEKIKANLRYILYTTVALLLVLLSFCTVKYGHPFIAASALLRIDEKIPESADAIVVLGGGRNYRIDKALELYRSGISSVLALTGDVIHLPGYEFSWPGILKKYSISKGVPERSVVCLEGCKSTRDDARITLNWCRKKSIKSIIVVTSEIHSLRSSMVFDRMASDTNTLINIYFVHAEDGEYSINNWWQNERGLIDTVNEWLKLLWYFLKGWI